SKEPPVAVSAAVQNPQSKAKESQLYQTAVNYLMKKDYTKAGSGFKKYVMEYPEGMYASSAYYWLGEVNLNKNNLVQAAENFQTVI
ncbi:outer membrane protein assembly factor BamD, partial [Escherichia coli]|nr:outer membrane protein assembly factor BamD [Escherichia coli]